VCVQQWCSLRETIRTHHHHHTSTNFSTNYYTNLLNLVLSKVDLQLNPANPMAEANPMPMLYAMHRMRSRARMRVYRHRIQASPRFILGRGGQFEARKLLALKLQQLNLEAAGSRWTLVLKGRKMRGWPKCRPCCRRHRATVTSL
jgi:hypothetical protein